MRFLYFISIGLCFLFFQCTIVQEYKGNRNSALHPPNPKEGACYAKCMIPSQYKIDTIEYILYTGNIEEENNSVEVEKVKAIIKPKSSKWDKRRSNKNCLSDNPDDCLIWCLVEIPAETIEYTTLKDTTTSKNYEIKSYEKKTLVKRRGFNEWREIVCRQYLTPNFVKTVQQSLEAKGAYTGLIDGIYNADFEAILNAYQKSKGLAVGQLNTETMVSLDLAMPR